MHKIANEADVASVLAQPLAVLYKHSPSCPLSGLAYEEVGSLRRRRGDVPVYLLDVIRDRLLARYVAERLGVVHASPQVIILRDGVPAWHGSHGQVRADALARRIEEAERV
jgi:bacillithiol system protein YtxJ